VRRSVGEQWRLDPEYVRPQIGQDPTDVWRGDDATEVENSHVVEWELAHFAMP
jgi:hypothetical protein